MLNEAQMELIPQSMRVWFDKEYCLAAILDDRYALQHVRNQTAEICIAAIREHLEAMQYVRYNQLSSVEIDMLLKEHQLLLLQSN